MAAATAARKRFERDGATFTRPVKANAVIHQNTIVVLLAGLAIAGRAGVDAAEAATMKAAGVAASGVTATAVDGETKVDVDYGTFLFANGDAITATSIGDPAYVLDNQTVTKGHAVNTRARAGRIEDVTSEGVWVKFGD
jgi:hypothetical protein